MPQNKLTQVFIKIFVEPIWEKKKNLALLIFSLLLLAFAQSLFLLLIGPFLKTMFSLTGESIVSGSAFLSENMQSLLPNLSSMTFEKSVLIFAIPGLLVCAALLKNIASYLYQVNSAYFGLLVAKRFRDRLFTAILNQSYRDISLRSPAEWMSLLMNDVLFLQNKFSDIANGLVRDSIMTLAAFVTLLFVHWQTALVLMVVTPFIAWGVGRTGRRIAKFTEQIQRKLAQLADLILEFRKRFEFIKAHKAESYEKNRFSKINTEYYRTIRKSIFVRSIFAPLLEFLSYAFFACILLYLSQGGISSHFSASDMVVFLAALGTMMRPLRQIGEQLTQFHETKGALAKSLDMLSTLSDKKDATKHAELKQPPKSYEIAKVTSGFDGRVSIDASSLSIQPGKAVAIIGPSGGGKSTLLKSIAGLLKPSQWQANLTNEELAACTSFVSQAPFLFDDTLLNNLKYGLESKIQIQDLSQYFDLASIEEEVSKFNKGLETHIKAIGSNISGGQKQRLVLVRALLREKNILLLDEATSSVDARMEENIVDKLLHWVHSQGKCLLAVTHRLGMLHKYDEIWFVENGKVASSGTFKQLMENARFKSFYDASL